MGRRGQRGQTVTVLQSDVPALLQRSVGQHKASVSVICLILKGSCEIIDVMWRNPIACRKIEIDYMKNPRSLLKSCYKLRQIHFAYKIKSSFFYTRYRFSGITCSSFCFNLYQNFLYKPYKPEKKTNNFMLQC